MMFSFDKDKYKGICVPYARFSTKGQSKVGKKSLERQLSEARRYAKQNNLFINEDLIFADKGVSGRSLSGDVSKAFKKGQMQVMLAMLDEVEPDQRQYVYVTFHNFDRFSRMSPDDAQASFNLILQKGFNIITTIDNQVYTRNNKNLSSMIITIIKMTTAWQESEVKSIYVKDALARKKEIVDYLYNHPSQKGRHQHIGVVQPSIPRWIDQEDITYEYIDKDGLKKVDTFKRFSLNEAKAKIVNYIFDLKISGLGYTRICQRLNSEGVPVFNQGKFKIAKKWHSFALQNIVKNEKILGHIVLKKTIVEEYMCSETNRYKKRKVIKPATEKLYNYYPSAVSEEKYFKANESWLNKPKSKPVGRIGERTNIFAKIMTCSCGGSLQYQRKIKKTKTKETISEYLSCVNATYKNNCNNKVVKYEELEKAFFRFVNNLNFRAICENGHLSIDIEIKSFELEISLINKKIEELQLSNQGLKKTFNSAIEKGMDATFVLESITKNEAEQTKEKEKILSLNSAIKKLEIKINSKDSDYIDIEKYANDLKSMSIETKIIMRKKINDFLYSKIEWMEVCSTEYHRFIIVCFGDNVIRTFAYSDNFASDLMFNTIKVNYDNLTRTQSTGLFIQYLAIIRESLMGKTSIVNRGEMLESLRLVKETHYKNLEIVNV